MALRLGLGLGLSGGVSFSPLSLFAASEPGFWFDPGDISTLFQDSAGTTPVTAAGQSVGLVLDKSKGLVLGAELVTNGDFSTGAGWTLGSGWTISGGMLNAGAVGSTVDTTQTITVVAGASYRVTYTVSNYSVGGVAVLCGGTVGQVRSTNGTYSEIIVAAVGGATPLRIRTTAASNTYSIDNISVRELPGNHATQSTSLSRPTYQVDSNGRGHLLFDGSDDFLVTPTITPGTDKVQVFAGVRKFSDAVRAMMVEWGNAVLIGKFAIEAPNTADQPNYYWITSGSLVGGAKYLNAAVAAPITNVLTGISEISTDTAILRVNGAQAATNTGDQGTGNYSAQPCYIGRRGGTTLPFNGRIYSFICRFGSNLTADQIAQTETWVNARTGAY